MENKKFSRVKKKKQCNLCKKRLTCVFTVCRCKCMFCASCSLPEIHDCVELKNIKEKLRENLKKSLIKVESNRNLEKF